MIAVIGVQWGQEGIEEANKEDEGFYIRSGIVTVLRNAEVQKLCSGLFNIAFRAVTIRSASNTVDSLLPASQIPDGTVM